MAFLILCKTKKKVLEMVQVTVLFHTFPPLMISFVGLARTETAAKTAPRVPKLAYVGERALQLSAWGTLATSGAGVVFHLHKNNPTGKYWSIQGNTVAKVIISFLHK